MFFGEEEEANKALKIFDDFAKDKKFLWKRFSDDRSNHPTWMDWHGDETDAVGSSSFMASRLIQEENVATEEARAALVDALLKTGAGNFLHVGGKGVTDQDPDSKATSVTPAWRKTLVHYVGGGELSETMTEEA